jgi:hypothetical protein
LFFFIAAFSTFRDDLTVFLFYQLDFVTPGISPLFANSLKHILHNPKARIKPCLLPHLKQRRCNREENFGFIFAFASCDVLAMLLKYKI